MKPSRRSKLKVDRRKPVRPPDSGEAFREALRSETQLIALVSLVVIVFIVFANALGNGFVFDDIYLVQENQALRNPSFRLLFNAYRPIRDISYALDFAVWGERPFGFHLTNLLVHAGNTLLVFSLLRRLSKDVGCAFLAALIFAVHPIQTDSVTYISGRRDLLFSLFYLSAFHSYLNYRAAHLPVKKMLWIISFIGLWALGLLSKEMAVSLPILLFVWQFCELWEPGGSWRQAFPNLRRTLAKDKWLWVGFGVLAAAFTFYWVFFRAASRRATFDRIEYWGGSFFTNFLTVTRVHAWYLKQLIYPTPIAQYLGVFEPSQSLFEWQFLLSFVIVAATLVSGFLLLNRDRLLAFGILSYFVLLLPVSQIIPHHELLADHYLYLPLMGFGLFVARLVTIIARQGRVPKQASYAVAALWVITLGTMTVIHNRTWKDERSLWTANYAAVPNSPRAALNLGNTYQDSDPARAEILFKRALTLNPTPSIKRTLYDRLAVILIEQKKLDEASFFVSEVLRESPNDFFGHLWSTQIHVLKKECDRARQELTVTRTLVSTPRHETLVLETEKLASQHCEK